MLPFFDAGQEAHGIIAVGQHATGVIAIGQVAHGVIAIGQAAFGVIAIGQLSFSFWGVGMLAFGVFGAGGFGVGGRGKGAVLPLVPSLGTRRSPPPLTTAQALWAGQADGWVEASLVASPQGAALVGPDGVALPIKLARSLVGPAARALEAGPSRLYARISRKPGALVCDRFMEVPVAASKKPGFWLFTAVRFVFLVAMAIAWALVVGQPLVDMLGTL